MKTLYDLLDARPDDDAERLKNAFRKAVKANHPDLHAGDPGAPTRLRHVISAYAILRHAEQRAAYHRLLELERERPRSKMRNFVSDAITVACLAVVLAGGYTLFAHISKASVEAVKVVEVTARGPAEIAADQPAERTDAPDRDELRDKLAREEVPNMAIIPSAVASEANSGRAPGIASGGPALSWAERDTEVGKNIDAFDAPIDRAEAKTTADDLKKNDGIEPLGQNRGRSVGVQFSALEEKDSDASKSSSSDFAISDEKHDMKLPGRARMVAKRQAANHTPFKPASVKQVSFTQASLENRNASACSGSQACSGRAPPLFGVGF
jgi:curved DNA-binding protein CbpA